MTASVAARAGEGLELDPEARVSVASVPLEDVEEKGKTFTGPRVWMADETRDPSTALLELAILATEDADAAVVLDDAMQVDAWDHAAILPMLVGVDLAPRIPHFSNVHQRARFNREYERAHHNANRPGYRLRGQSTRWARAVLAAMIFGNWPHAKRLVPKLGTRSPFELAREMHRQGKRGRVECGLCGKRHAACVSLHAGPGEPASPACDTCCDHIPGVCRPVTEAEHHYRLTGDWI